jgi:hypothetical protein
MTENTTPVPAWVAGGLGQALGDIPLGHSQPALVADLSPGGPHLFNGTATLVELGSKKLAITCHHVLQKYVELRNAGRLALFQIGKAVLDPVSQLIASDSKTDLAIIGLSAEQIITLEKGSEARFLVPPRWPPNPVKEGDFVSLGGYPGSFRKVISWDTLDFTSYSVGATPVSTVSETSIGCRFERDRWVWTDKRPGLVDPKELGGLSGAPAFVLREIHWELAGIIFEFSEDFDIMFLRPASVIGLDGSIRPL